MNPLYNQLMGGGIPQRQFSGGPVFQNPVQKMQYMMQAMRNPEAFVRQAIPDLPNNIANDPNQILRYLQETRGISDQQIQMLAGQMPRF